MNIREEFRQSLQCGTGKAFFILENNPNVDFFNEILDAALTNFAYDPQSEGSRDDYVARLINLCGRKDEIVTQVLKSLATEQENTWNLVQLFELAEIFAQDGNKNAHQAIYERYHKKVIPGSVWCGEDAIINLDGIRGLKYIAETRGKALLGDMDDWEPGFLVQRFQDENPEIKVYDELKKEAKNNPYIQKYLDAIAENRQLRNKKVRRTKYNYQRVRENIKNKRTVPVSPAGARQLTIDEINKLADDFLCENDSLKQEKYLRVFAFRKYPYDYQPILQIAKERNSRSNQRVRYACWALQYFQAGEIRQFAIEKLNKTKKPSDYLHLLISNYEKGDSKLLEKIAKKQSDDEAVHSIGGGFIDIYTVNKVKECKSPLELIYQNLTCGICRHKAVTILHENGVLSDEILSELEFDSYEEVRQLYEEIKKSQK